jgi:2-keto-4-pentenoate hydratase/2-oxohepta-3-ene-1,7-dioic acid hydratase in catechol pathway
MEICVGSQGGVSCRLSLTIPLARLRWWGCREGGVVRWIRFSLQGRTAYGILDGERIREVVGDPFRGYETTAHVHALAEVRIEVPVLPTTFYCVGLNYAEHVMEAAKKLGIQANLPTQPDVGYRAVNALVAHGEPVILPADARKVQYEGELAVVIGKRAKHLSEDEALSCILGYTIGNDVSERSWQKSDRTLWRAKNTDSFKPMGPWIETDVDLAAMETRVRVNGAETTRFSTNAMLFGIAAYLCTITRYVTLYPGDVMWMGTDGTSPDLKAGDVVEVEISGIGTLRNPFLAACARG